jgi:hypothetical protein
VSELFVTAIIFIYDRGQSKPGASQANLKEQKKPDALINLPFPMAYMKISMNQKQNHQHWCLWKSMVVVNQHMIEKPL